MATLTQDEIAYIRLSIGDGCDVIGDVQIQYAHDLAESDECGRNALLSRWLWMRVKPTTITLFNGSQGISTAVVKIYKDRLDYWEQCAGKGLATLTVGTLNLALDTVPDDLDNVDAVWLWGE